jgi:hypothetical protein
MEEASTSYLDTLLYEQVTDVGVRRKLRHASQGRAQTVLATYR